MDAFITEIAKYGSTTLMVAFVIFLLRGQIGEMLKGSNDTAKLIAAIDKNSEVMKTFGEGLTAMADQFNHNNQMFHGISHTAEAMLTAIQELRIDMARGSK